MAHLRELANKTASARADKSASKRSAVAPMLPHVVETPVFLCSPIMPTVARVTTPVHKALPALRDNAFAQAPASPAQTPVSISKPTPNIAVTVAYPAKREKNVLRDVVLSTVLPSHPMLAAMLASNSKPTPTTAAHATKPVTPVNPAKTDNAFALRDSVIVAVLASMSRSIPNIAGLATTPVQAVNPAPSASVFNNAAAPLPRFASVAASISLVMPPIVARAETTALMANAAKEDAAPVPMEAPFVRGVVSICKAAANIAEPATTPAQAEVSALQVRVSPLVRPLRPRPALVVASIRKQTPVTAAVAARRVRLEKSVMPETALVRAGCCCAMGRASTRRSTAYIAELATTPVKREKSVPTEAAYNPALR